MHDFVFAIIARSGSSRFPNKISSYLGQHTILETIEIQCRLVSQDFPIYLVTSDDKSDDKLVKVTDLDVFRGSLNNVLLRLKRFSQHLDSKNIVCILGDNPVVDSNIIKDVLKLHLESNSIYTASATNEYPNLTRTSGRFPIGTRIQIIATKFLQNLKIEAIEKRYLEHPWAYFAEKMDPKSLNFLFAENQYFELNRPELNFSVNYPANLKGLNLLYNHIQSNNQKFSNKIELGAFIDALDLNKQWLNLLGQQ